MPDTPVLWRAAQRVNLDTSGRVDTPHIIQLDNGRIAVTYDYDELDGIPANGFTDLYARYFTQNGDGAFSISGGETPSLQQREHRLNREWTNDHQQDHDIISLPNRGTGDLPAGEYAMVYEHSGNGNHSIRLEISGVSGAVTSLTIVEDTDSAFPQSSNPALALSGDTIMVVYQHQTSERNTDIYYRLYDLDTGTLGPATLHLNFAGRNTDAQIATLLNGNFVTVAENDAFDGAIVYNITAPDGTVIVSTDAITSTEGNSQAEHDPQIAALANGGFVVAWEVDVPSGTALRFEVFGSSGTSISGVTTFGNLASPNYDHISIAALDDGGFVIVTDDNAQNRGVMQRFDRFGNTVGDQVIIENTAGFSESDVMQLHDGRIAVSYQGADGEIYMAIYDIRDEASEGLSVNDINGVIIGHAGDNQSPLNGGELRDGRYLFGGPGDDLIYGSNSALNLSQFIDGGAGTDTLIINGIVNFIDGTAYSNHGPLLASFANIENFRGSGEVTADNNDNILTFIGSSDDYANPGGGNDIVTMGDGNDTVRLLGPDINGADRDRIDGGNGVDTLILAGGSNDRFTIDLARGTLSHSNGYSASATNFENVYSAATHDSIIGNAADNILSTGSGNDIVIGQDGDDILIGGEGVDELYGGGDNDTFYDVATEAGKHIIDGNAGVDTWYIWSGNEPADAAGTGWTVNLNSQFASNGSHDILVYNIENVVGGNGHDRITGTSGNNILQGWWGNDTLIAFGGNNTLDGGEGDDTLIGGAGLDSFDGGNGIDLLDYSNSTASFYLDTSLLFLDEGGQVEAYSNIENFRFGSGNDFFDLTGGTFFEVDGGAGNDEFVLALGSGQKILRGGDGIDTLRIFTSDTVQIDLANSTITYTATSTIASYIYDFENASGTNLNDRIYGNDSTNTLEGLGGNDILLGRGGDDTLRGGDGEDQLSGDAGKDFLYGGADNDYISGGLDGDFLFGEAGDDRLEGDSGDDFLSGGAGADYLDGGTGVDTANYAASASAVTVDLLMGSASGGDATGDTLASIENVTGSSHRDTLYGDNSANILSGGSGNDVLNGRDGRDIMYGGAGNDVMFSGTDGDTINGGDGLDRASYAASRSAIHINLDLGTASGGHAQGDTLVSIELITASQYDDTIIGDSQNNSITGLRGQDYIDGGAGDDTIYGDQTGSIYISDDTLFGGSGDDKVFGGGGNDVIDGGIGIDVLYGDNGSDILTGGGDSDTIDGGEGIDYAVYSGNSDQYTIVDNGNGTFTIIDNKSDRDGKDILTNVEMLRFADKDVLLSASSPFGTAEDDVLVGTAKSDTIDGLAGNDIIYGLEGDDTLNGGDGDDLFIGGHGSDVHNGGNGIDTVDYSAATARIVVNMATTGRSGDAAGDTYSSIERVIGTDYADILTGNASDNELHGGGSFDVLDGAGGDDDLYGGDGWDRFIGGSGADSHDGGTGLDTMDYRTSTSRVVLNLETGGTVGDAAGDSFTSIERVFGSNFNDIITGDDADNILYGYDSYDVLEGGAGDDDHYGGEGWDRFVGGAGADHHDGGEGVDTIDYRGSTARVVLSLATGGTSGDAAGDSFTSVERIFGTDHNDIITGDSANNFLFGYGSYDILDGGAGDDVLDGGEGWDRFIGGEGADSHDGGDGTDSIDYSRSASRIEVSLASGGTVGDAAGDSFVSVERVFGSHFDDVITGDALDNRLHGNDGADTLNGGAGNDFLFGGNGNDTLSGGEGSDTLYGMSGVDHFAYETGNGGADTIFDFVAGAASDETIIFDGSDPAFDSFAEVMAVANQVGNNTTFDFGGGNTLTIIGAQIGDFTSDDFAFGTTSSAESQDAGKPDIMVSESLPDEKADILIYEPMRSDEKTDIPVYEPWEEDGHDTIKTLLAFVDDDMPIYQTLSSGIMAITTPDDVDYFDYADAY